MRTPWQWLLDYTGVTAEIKRLEKKVYHTEDTVRQRDGQISKLHKAVAEIDAERAAWFVKYKALEPRFPDRA